MRYIKNLPVRAHQYRVEKIVDNYRIYYYYVPDGTRIYVVIGRNISSPPVAGVIFSFDKSELTEEQLKNNIV